MYRSPKKKEREKSGERREKFKVCGVVVCSIRVSSAQQAGLMGIVVTDGGTVFLSSSKEHALFSLKQKDMLGGTETLTKVG